MLTKEEIDFAIRNKDDFVKMDYLRRFLREADSLDIKKYLLLRLASICEERGIFSEAVRHVAKAAEIAITYREKIDLYMKETELYVKNFEFDSADKSLGLAMSYANSQEKMELQIKNLDFYRAHGRTSEKADKKRKAIEVYERLIQLKQPIEKKIEVKEKLIELYDKLGRVRDAERMKHLEFQERPRIEFD